MLDFLRTASTGWLAKILIGLLVISFAIWGISGSLFFGSNSVVVQVGDTKVTTTDYRIAYENQLLALSQQFGRRLARQEADQFGLRQTVVNQVVAGAVLDENTRKMGLGVGEKDLAKAIAADPAFRDLSGNFSRNALEVTLRQNGISQEDYITGRKRVALRNQLQSGTSEALNLPEVFNNALLKFRNEKRVLEYVEIGPEIVETQPEPTDADVSKYYDENKTSFVAPEYRKLDLVILQAATLSKPDEVTDEEIQAEYDNRKNSLVTPERRTVEQLVLANADEAKTISDKLAAGESFEAVVEGLGKKVSDLSLGTVAAPELPDEKVRAAAFAAELNTPTEVVEGIFGPVILRVTAIESEKTTALDEIRDRLQNDIAIRLAGDRVFEFYDLIEEERGAGEDLVTAAKRVELESRTIDAIDASGLDKEGVTVAGIPNLRNLLEEAFNSQPGDDTRPVEIGSDGFVWFEVKEIIPERQKELDEVKDNVKTAWVASEVNKSVEELANKISDRLKANGDFAEIAEELLPADSLGQPAKATTSTAVSRNQPNSGLSPQIVQAGFGIAEDGVAVTASAANKFAVVTVKTIEMSGNPKFEENEIENINFAASADMLSQVVQDLQSRETVSINQNAVQAAFNPYGGGGHSGQ